MPNFTVYEGPADENAPTFAGGRIRNEKGMCAIAKCKKPLGEGSEHFIFGQLCPECTKKTNEVIEKWTS